MGNIISISQCCGGKCRPTSIFGKSKNGSKSPQHISKPIIRIYSGTSSTKQSNANNIQYPTMLPYFIDGNLVN